VFAKSPHQASTEQTPTNYGTNTCQPSLVPLMSYSPLGSLKKQKAGDMPALNRK